jgi:hypothetical protein
VGVKANVEGRVKSGLQQYTTEGRSIGTVTRFVVGRSLSTQAIRRGENGGADALLMRPGAGFVYTYSERIRDKYFTHKVS